MVSASFVQGASGLAFGCFAVVHLVNHGLAAVSPQLYNEYQAFVRQFYTSTIGDTLVLSSIVVHLGAWAYKKFFNGGEKKSGSGSKPAAATPKPVSKRLHKWTGYFLAALVFGHVAGCRYSPVPNGHIVFENLSFLIKEGNLTKYFFHLYLGSFALAGAIHLGIGVPKALRMVGLTQAAISSQLPAKLLMILLAIGCQLGLLGLHGWLYPLPVYRGTAVVGGLE
jgi:hypothetical protein